MPLPDLDEEEIDDELDLNPEVDNDPEDDEDDSPNPSVNTLDPESIARLAAQTALQVHQQNQPARQFTEAELNTQLGRFEVTPEHIATMFDPEAKPEVRMALLQKMLDASAQYAVRGSQVLQQNALTPLQQQLAQVQEFNRDQKIKTLTSHVERRYPTLAGKKVVIREAIQSLIASGYTPPNGSATAVQKEIAKFAAQRIQTVDPTFSLKGNGQRQAGSFGSRNSNNQGPAKQMGSGPKTFLDAFS